MGKELAEVIVENGIEYHLAEDGCYYPDINVEQNTDNPIGKYGMMRGEYLMKNDRHRYFRMVLDGTWNEYLYGAVLFGRTAIIMISMSQECNCHRKVWKSVWWYGKILYRSIKVVCWFGLGGILHGKSVQDNRRKNMGKGNALYDFQKQCRTCILRNL